MHELSRPRHLLPSDALEDFDCGVTDLDQWLRKRARSNDLSGATRTYVSTYEGRVVAYYALTVGSIEHAAATGKVRRNMPEPVPVAVLARLAVGKTFQGTGWGGDLLIDAVSRVLSAAEIFGIRAMLIHAFSERACAFYERHDFVRSPIEGLTLMATLSDLRRTIANYPHP